MGTERLLVVEDEPGLLIALEDRLKLEGYAVVTETNGVRAEEKAKREGFDLILLDIMLPGRDGLQICQNLRAANVHIPVLMLTAKGSDIDTVVGLRMGADDYLPKPFDMQVLLARIQALLRRSGIPRTVATPTGNKYAIGEFVLDTGEQELRKRRDVVPLNAKEYQLLKYLVEHPNRVLSRDQLLNEVWGYDSLTTTRTVDVHVAWLRQKLEEKDSPRYLITVRGYGYKFVPDKE